MEAQLFVSLDRQASVQQMWLEKDAMEQTTQSSSTLNCCAQLWHGDAQHGVTKNPLVTGMMDAKLTTELRAFGKPGRQK